ncbi:MAG: anaerobic sulfatase maturase [Proteobacteria bacterium]|nr:anaerobic sulfatase maturase [Pseudomonadota bacterium]
MVPEKTAVGKNTDRSAQGIHVMVKPIGPVCNLNCEYCFYLEKQCLFGAGKQCRMSDEVLSTFITNYITSQPTPIVEFVWQGGEPTLLGIDFFRRVLELQRPFVSFKNISNSLQTNGTLLTNEWCSFLRKNRFMVGISLDGPEEVHDTYRRDRAGKGSFARAMRGLRLLQKHHVEYNVLACVAQRTAQQPLDVYRFLREQGVEFMQFVPVVERRTVPCSIAHGLCLAGPAVLDRKETHGEITPWSVIPSEYGAFLVTVYEEWVRHDVGTVFVMNFEWALNTWIGNPSPVCVHAQQCGRALVLEHNGDVYACDHCVYPEFRLGNVRTDSLLTLTERSLQSGFGSNKDASLPQQCKECEVLVSCRGGCPKHRFAESCSGEPGLHYLCEGYRKFFLHIRKYQRAMTTLLENNLPISLVMEAVKGPLVIKRQASQRNSI